MSDIILGALIGVGGAALGSIITGIIAYYRSKQQISARSQELSQQLAYNEQQARINRQIKLRERSLIPLKEAVSKWLVAQNKEQVMIVRMETAYNKKSDSKEIAQEIKLWEESGKNNLQVTSELEALQGQLSDSTLNQMIEIAKESCWEASQEGIRLLFIISNPKDSDTNLMLRTIKEYRSHLNKLRGYLFTVNKRIDDLLIGEP